MIKKILKFVSLILVVFAIVNLLFQINIFSISNNNKAFLQSITIYSIACFIIISSCYRFIIKYKIKNKG